MDALVSSAVAASAHDQWLLAALAFFAAAAEALVVVGAVVPGTAILLAVAALAGAQGSASLAFAVLVAATLGAIAGDGSAYWLGRRYGRELFAVWPLSRFPGWLPRGEAYFARHGGKSVFWGRFVPGVKTVVPVVAGIGHMPIGRFVVANVASAVLWSLTLVLGGLGIGRGLDRYGLADRRVVVLLAVLVLVLALAYAVLRLVVVRGVPLAAQVARWALERLASRPGRGASLATRVLEGRSSAPTALLWAAIFAAAVIGFVSLLGQVLFDRGFSRADEVLSNAVQSLRLPNLDAVMIAVTMAGDGLVLSALAVAALLWLLARREWTAAGAAAAAFAATMLFVPLVKALLARERPFPLYPGSESFSFPSGHASHLMVVFGSTAVLLAHHLGVRGRLAIYSGALGLALTVGVSRVYLGAHWPSDVAGGLLFGAALVAMLGFVLRDRPMALRPGWMALGLGLVYAAAYGLHVERGYALWTRNYTHAAEPVEMTEAAWRDGGWAALPRARIGLGDAFESPLAAQVAGDPEAFARALAEAGWREQRAPVPQRILSALLPYGGLDALPAAMVLHDGRPPVAVLVAPAEAGRRLVLRLWPSGMLLADGTPLALAGLAAETFAPVAFGFGDLDREPATTAETRRLREALRAAPGLAVQSQPDPDAPLLVRVVPPGG